MKTALLFAGQATQYVGMGKNLYANYPEARQVFECANDALNESFSHLIFDGSVEELNLTANTQPAVLTMACAAWAVLKKRGCAPTVVAGHSLGEYSALVAAGALDFADAVRLCRRRGQYMQSAVPEGVGAMAAIQRLTLEDVASVCESVEGYCVPSVYNAPKLIVISGEREAVDAAVAKMTEMKAMIFSLAVSAPFHCALLAPATHRLKGDIEGTPFSSLEMPYICNVDAQWHADSTPTDIRERLVRQVEAPVRWSQSIALMIERGIERFWHVGPGRANLSHVKRQARRMPMASVDDEAHLKQMLDELERSSD